MKWYRAVVYERVEVGRDETRNPVCKLQETGRTFLVRLAPFEGRHDATEGNGFDVIERTFLTKADASVLAGADAIEVGGVFYEVEGVSSWDSPLALKVKRVKSDELRA